MITWSSLVLPDVGVLFIVFDVGTWFYNALMRLVWSTIEVSSYWSSKPMCQVVDVVLYCRHCFYLSIDYRMFHLVA
jgi:hypothetical protein